MIPIASPLINTEEVNRAVEVLRSGIIAMGSKVKEFEGSFSKYTGVRTAISVSNGTVALWLALEAHGIGQGDEVVTTPFTFIATANSILFCGAKPVFADIDERTYNISPEEVVEKITSKTRAIIGVHLYGQSFDLKSIIEICEDNNLILIEDAAQAHGAEFDGRKVGSFGTGCFSFYPTKNMTTGEGGIITTDDERIAEKIRLLRNHGEQGKYNHVMLGYNMRMTDIQAAIGIEQLKKLDEMNEKRRRNAEYFDRNIKAKGIVKPFVDGNVKHVYHQYVLRIEDETGMTRDEFAEYLTSKGVGNAVHYPLPVYLQPFYRKLGFEKGLCPIVEEIARKVISIPVHPKLSEEELKYIVDVINGD
jgi:perosamine synthetase